MKCPGFGTTSGEATNSNRTSTGLLAICECLCETWHANEGHYSLDDGRLCSFLLFFFHFYFCSNNYSLIPKLKFCCTGCYSFKPCHYAIVVPEKRCCNNSVGRLVHERNSLGKGGLPWGCRWNKLTTFLLAFYGWSSSIAEDFKANRRHGEREAAKWSEAVRGEGGGDEQNFWYSNRINR